MEETTGRFKTNYNQQFFPDQGEKNFGKSLTRPNMALSISDLLDRLQRGQSVTGDNDPRFDEEDPDDSFYVIPDFNKLDLAEKEAYARAAADEVQRLRGIMAEKAKELREAKEKADKEAQRHAWEQERARQEAAYRKPKFGPGGEPESTNTP